ncbi:MAG: ImmA/IrrE family metallo-endopeptidase [Patescibacteria group bacterium]
MTTPVINIEQETKKVRVACGATTIPVDVRKIIGSLGLKLMSTDLNDSLSGAFLRKEKIVVVNKNHSLLRKRFTIAHEIGHYKLHETENDKEFIDGIFKREKGANANTLKVEMEANQFAASLLMPRDEIIQEFHKQDPVTGDYITDLSEKFKVSHESMNYRLINLGLTVPQ